MKLTRWFLIPCIVAIFSNTDSIGGTYEEELRSLSGSLGASLEKAGLKTIAIGAFKNTEGTEPTLGKLLAEELSVELVNQNQGVSVVDRANLNRLMEEHKLTEEGLIDPENARKLKLEGIDAIILGTIIPFENAYRVSLKAIATDSAKIVAATRGTINETDTLNSLMGQSRPKIVAIDAPDELSPREAATPDPRSVKKEPVDFGRVAIAVKSITLHQQTGRALVAFTVTDTAAGNSFCYRLIHRNGLGTDPRFTRGLKGKKPPFNLGDFMIDGKGTDDKGNSYVLRMPSDAGNIVRLSRDRPTDFQLEFQVVPPSDGRISLPEAFTFWFHFYGGHPNYFNAEKDAFRFSVSEYPFDKVL